WREHLKETGDPAADIGYTAAVRRSHHRYRMAVVGQSAGQWRMELERAVGRAAESRLRLCWMFAGQGPQSAAMGCELWREEAAFRQGAGEALRALQAAGWQHEGLFERDLGREELEQTAVV